MAGFQPLPTVGALSHVLLEPDAFRPLSPNRPSEPVVVGLRLIASGEEETARAEAAKYAVGMLSQAVKALPEGHHMTPHERELQEETYEDALLRWVVARCTCQAADVSQPYWKMPEDTVRECLTSDGVRYIFHAYERMRIEHSPIEQQIDDSDLGELASLLEPAILDQMAGSQAKRLRRILAFALAQLRAVANVE